MLIAFYAVDLDGPFRYVFKAGSDARNPSSALVGLLNGPKE